MLFLKNLSGSFSLLYFQKSLNNFAYMQKKLPLGIRYNICSANSINIL